MLEEREKREGAGQEAASACRGRALAGNARQSGARSAAGGAHAARHAHSASLRGRQGAERAARRLVTGAARAAGGRRLPGARQRRHGPLKCSGARWAPHVRAAGDGGAPLTVGLKGGGRLVPPGPMAAAGGGAGHCEDGADGAACAGPACAHGGGGA